MIRRKRIIKKEEIETTDSDSGFVPDNETDFISDKAIMVDEKLRAEFDQTMNKATMDALSKVTEIASKL